jgi:hypothetical protein
MAHSLEERKTEIKRKKRERERERERGIKRKKEKKSKREKKKKKKGMEERNKKRKKDKKKMKQKHLCIHPPNTPHTTHHYTPRTKQARTKLPLIASHKQKPRGNMYRYPDEAMEGKR